MGATKNDKYTDPELREEIKEKVKEGDKGGQPGYFFFQLLIASKE